MKILVEYLLLELFTRMVNPNLASVKLSSLGLITNFLWSEWDDSSTIQAKLAWHVITLSSVPRMDWPWNRFDFIEIHTPLKCALAGNKSGKVVEA